MWSQHRNQSKRLADPVPLSPRSAGGACPSVGRGDRGGSSPIPALPLWRPARNPIFRHSRAGGNPSGVSSALWTPACAGMTNRVAVRHFSSPLKLRHTRACRGYLAVISTVVAMTPSSLPHRAIPLPPRSGGRCHEVTEGGPARSQHATLNRTSVSTLHLQESTMTTQLTKTNHFQPPRKHNVPEKPALPHFFGDYNPQLTYAV